MKILGIVRLQYFLKVFLACCVFTLICNAYFAFKDESLHSKIFKLIATPPIFHQYDNISLPPNGFLVWNENCHIPKLEIFSQYIKTKYIPYKKYVCAKTKPLVLKTYDSNLDQYRLQLDEPRYRAGLYDCCYKEVLQHLIERNKYE